jgi:glucose repression mediator protein
MTSENNANTSLTNANASGNIMNAANLNKLAEYCATNGDYNSAIEYYTKLTSIDPDNGPAWTALGHCYLLIEDLQKSFNAYQHALYSLEDIKDP